jgi:hypothetical protein
MKASDRITQHLDEFTDWRGKTLARLRTLIGDTEPDLIEEWKWNTPVWSYKGNVLAVGAFQDHVKINFFKGASLEDPHGLFNAGLAAKTSRAIDVHEGDCVNEGALKRLVRAATDLNCGHLKSKTPIRKRTQSKGRSSRRKQS